MSDLVALQPCMYTNEWVAYAPEVVRKACISECGREAMKDCWGPEGPQPGDHLECGTAFVRICCDMPEIKPEYVEIVEEEKGRER